MTAYYNEIDPYAADWLRNLIAAGRIAPGDVDTRSIADVSPADLAGYTQCHFFAGIGVWSAALRGAGWSDDRPVWTGSCPCQPFSAAGRGEGFADERHLWPAWHHLIAQRRPPVVFGEQVASKAVDPWIDLVQADMETVGYAFGAVAFPSAGVGAPHIRDRTYFVADADLFAGGQGRSFNGRRDPRSDAPARAGLRSGGGADVLADASGADGTRQVHQPGERPNLGRERMPDRGRLHPGRMADADLVGAREEREQRGWELGGLGGDEGAVLPARERPGPTNGFWRDPDWLFCRDGKWRPVEPGTSPLAHGARSRVGRDGADQEAGSALPRKDQGSRVGRLRAYGNAINQKAAEAFILSYDDTERFRLTSVSIMSDDIGVFA